MKQFHLNCTFLLISFFSVLTTTYGQKIFPGAVGYGTEFRGAYAGDKEPTILIVDTLFAGSLQTGTNRGSFQWAVTQSFPRIIVFEVGGVIDYSSTSRRYINISSPYINIYGQTAPSPGITLKSISVYFTSHDLLMQHIAIRYGDYPKPDGTIEVQDCFTGMHNSYNAVLDHCSFSWSLDEVISTYGSHFTLSNCLLYEPLHYSYHCNENGENEPETHGYGPIAESPIGLTVYNNLFGWFTDRFPRMKTDSIAYINNYATGYSYHGPDIRKADTGNNGAFIGNNFYPTSGLSHYMPEYFMHFRSGLDNTSKVFLKDNNCIRSDNGYAQRECIWNEVSDSDFKAIFTDNLGENVIDVSEYKIVSADDVIDSVLINSGFRPWDRDLIDSLAIEKLKANNQDWLNSPRAQPAKAYNIDTRLGLETTDGNMDNGYDFSSNNVSFTVNGTTVSLNTNLTSQSAVLRAINSQLPDGIEAVDHPAEVCKHIIIQTTSTGVDQEIVIGGDASVFGIANGTYIGQDSPYPDLAYEPNSWTLNIPMRPHADDDNDGYTNIEEWAHSFPEEIVFDTVSTDDSLTLINIDCGPIQSMTEGNWNNFTIEHNTPDSIIHLIDSYGDSTGVTAYVYDPFGGVNSGGGTFTPDSQLDLPVSVTSDSYYGHTENFLDRVEPTGGFIFENLELNISYNFEIFSSMMDVSDNREVLYAVIGENEKNTRLDASNNSSNIALIENIYPDSEGKILLSAEPGSNNDNSYGLFYLGAIRITYNPSTLTAKQEVKLLEDTLNIFPVPFDDKLSIVNVPLKSIVCLYSIEGVKILEVQNNLNRQIQLDTSGIHSGIYILRVSNGVFFLKTMKVVKS